MNLQKHDNCWYLNFSKDVFLHVINDWSQLFGKYNWYSFHILHIYMENDIMTGGVEAEVVILGLGIRFRWNYNDEVDKMVKRVEIMTAGGIKHPPQS